MARSKEKLSFASTDSKPKLKTSSADWRRIEAAYGHLLSKTLRQQIRKETNKFLAWVVFEHTVRPKSEAAKRAHQFKKAVQDVRRVFFQRPQSITRDVDFFVQHRICEHQGLRWEKGRNGLQALVLKLDRIVSQGCDRVIAELRAREPGFRAGETWDLWVRNLTKILKLEGLPTQARKDTDKQTESSLPSPFIGFLRELQQCIPPEFRRSTHSDGALAQAIYEARSAPRREPKRPQRTPE